MRVSVIVPIYNVAEYLPRCIESLLQQICRDIEIILVDDGSTDKCLSICEAYASVDNRIVVIHQENKGVSAARNAGLDKAKGEYIGFVDPDDWVAPEMYGEMLSAIEQSKTDLAICGYNYFNEEGILDMERTYPVRREEIVTQKEVMRRFSDIPPSIRHGVWNKLFKNNLLHTMRFKEELHSSEDVLFLDEYVARIQNAVIIHKPFYKNTVRGGSATHGGLNVDALADSYMAHDKMYADIVERYPDLKDYSQAFLLDALCIKYGMAEKKLAGLSEEERKRAECRLKEMKKHIKGIAFRAVFNREIYWKTRIYYCIF